MLACAPSYVLIYMKDQKCIKEYKAITEGLRILVIFLKGLRSGVLKFICYRSHYLFFMIDHISQTCSGC